MKKSTFGLDQNIASLCCYAGWFITGIVFLSQEREDKTVRFHALQSILWFAALAAVHVAASIFRFVVGWIPFFGNLVTGMIFGLLGLVWFASWLVLMFMGYSGKRFKLPIIGDIAEKQIEK